MRATTLATLLLGASLAMNALTAVSAGTVEKSYWGRDGQYVPDPAREPARNPVPGLMVKLLQVTPEGALRAVSPRRVFNGGDRFKLEVRPNVKGYVYVFNQEEGNRPRLIHAPLGGRKPVEAGRKILLPGKSEFEFDSRPGREKLIVVLAQQPLDSGREDEYSPIAAGGYSSEESGRDKAIYVVAPEDRFEGGKTQLVYTLELKHE